MSELLSDRSSASLLVGTDITMSVVAGPGGELYAQFLAQNTGASLTLSAAVGWLIVPDPASPADAGERDRLRHDRRELLGLAAAMGWLQDPEDIGRSVVLTNADGTTGYGEECTLLPMYLLGDPEGDPDA